MPDFKSLLAELPVGLTKGAGIEAADEVQLEQDFANLAYTFLSDRAAGLIPYLLGFEVVEREEDGSKAVGIFGFKIGEDYYYVPAFFVNSQVKGMDLLYSKKTNMFMPLKETWVNFILNRQMITLGDGANAKEAQKDYERPRFDFLVDPPVTSRGGYKAASDKTAAELIDDGFQVWNELQQGIADSLEKDAGFQQAWSGAIARLERQQLPFEKTAADSQLINMLQNHGGVPAVNALMTEISTNYDFAKAALAFYPGVESLFVTSFDASTMPEKQAKKITIETQVCDYMDGKEKKRIVRDGFTIKDERDVSEKSETYDIDYERSYQSPDCPGKYRVLLATGGTTEGWVLSPAGGVKENAPWVVIDPNGRLFKADSNAIYVRGDEMEEAKPDAAYNKAIDIKSVKTGGKYVFLNADGDFVGPFEIKSSIAENGKRRRYSVRSTYERTHSNPYGKHYSIGRGYRGCGIDAPCDPEDADQVELVDQPGRMRCLPDRTLVLPSNWKALEVAEREGGEDLFRPGTLNDMLEALSKNAFHQLRVDGDGVEYSIQMDGVSDGRPMNYKSAAVRLVGQYGLDYDDAEEILKEANDSFKARRLVKLGQVGVEIPQVDQQAMGVDPYTGVATQAPQVDMVEGGTVGAPIPQDPTQQGFNIGGESQMDMEAAGIAQEAAEAGQKQVFDHATIGGLSRVYDVGAIVDTYVPDMMKALDRLGRVLFLFYWKNEEFAERYGTQDMAEMEDSIRGVFKSFGDLVLDLREKAIEPDDAGNTVIG